MKVLPVLLAATVVAGAVANGAGAAVLKGAVVGRDAARHAVAVAAPVGTVRTVHVARMPALGTRLSVRATRRADGMFEGRQVRTLGRTGHARLHGTVVRQTASRTLLSAGGTVLSVRSHVHLKPGSVVTVDVAIKRDGLRGTRVVRAGRTGQIEIEGTVATVSPLTVKLEEGATIAVLVPASVTLPAGLAPGDEIEAVVTFAEGTYTLVSIDDSSVTEPPKPGHDHGREVEAHGTVIALGATSITVQSNEDDEDGGGAPVTFVVPVGFDLHGAQMGSRVEAKGTSVNGVITLTKIEVKGSDDDQGDGDGGHDGGDGGHHGGGGGGDDGE